MPGGDGALSLVASTVFVLGRKPRTQVRITAAGCAAFRVSGPAGRFAAPAPGPAATPA